MTKYKKKYSKATDKSPSGNNTGKSGVKDKGTAKANAGSGSKRADTAAGRGASAKTVADTVHEKKGISLAAAIVVGAVIAIILELSLFDIFGQFGGWLKYGQFGLFGSMAYVFPVAVLLFFIGISSKVKHRRYVVLGAVLFIFLCAFSHLLSTHSLNNRNVFSYFKNCAESKSGGGIIGGAVALGLYLFLSQTGAVIICILVMLICLFFIFEKQLKALFSYIFSGSGSDEYEDDEEYYEEYEQPEEHRPRRRKNSYIEENGEPVYITEDDECTVIHIVKAKNKRGRSHETQLVRINKKAKPMRESTGTRQNQRSERKARGVSDQLEMFPRNASGDEVHEITSRSTKKQTDNRSRNKVPDYRIYEEPPKESRVNEPPEPAFDRSRARVTRVKEAAVNREAKQARPVKTRRDDQVPGQREIDRDKLGGELDATYAGDKAYHAPPMELLDRVRSRGKASEADLERIARNLEEILARFSVNVTVTDIQAGPSVTRFELIPELGTRVGKITALSDDLKLNLGVTEIRIEAPIPGRQAVGIEIPNKNRQTVYMRELLEEPSLINHPSRIAFAAGKDISGNVIVSDIAKMPHLLVAGTTGSGKSVFLNTILMTILYRARPSEVGLIIIDPKQVEFGVYAGIPHLMKDVVTDPGQAVSTLRWAVNEMSNRYQRMKLSSVRDFKAYNAKVEKGQVSPEEENPRKMNQIVIIIDELADLMMVAKKEAESLICRLAQLARAAGIHLIIATQRPSVDVVTGLIKANVPARVALLVSSQIDSRTIIDMPGAEKLLGNGDMLFYPTGYVKPVRIQGAFVSDDEVQKTVSYLIENNKSDYFSAESDEIEKFIVSGPADAQGADGSGSQDASGKYDDCFYEAGKMCIELKKASSSMLQRRFSLGFNRAARIIEQLEEFGVVGPQNGAKPRQILMDLDTFEQMYNEMTGQ